MEFIALNHFYAHINGCFINYADGYESCGGIVRVGEKGIES